MDYDPRIKTKAFDQSTTYRDEFRRYVDVDKREKYRWPRSNIEPVDSPPKPYHPNDPETFMDWRQNIYIPFNLLIKPRPIIDTNPQQRFSYIDETIDTEKENVMKTRPRLYISPAVSMDDIPDPEMRKMLCQHMYTTEWRRSEKEAAGPQSTSPPQYTTFETAADQVVLKTDLFPPVPSGCRETAKQWDIEQTRACVDPTRTFWIHKDPPIKCGACVNPYKGLVAKEVKEEIARLIETDTLRSAHDRPIPGYAGHKPIMTMVPLPKSNLSVTHPLLSVAQATTKYYAVDKSTKKTEC